MSTEGSVALASGVAASTSLEILDLRSLSRSPGFPAFNDVAGNKLGDAGATALAESVVVCSSLTVLDIAGAWPHCAREAHMEGGRTDNAIGDYGAVAIVATTKTLKALDISRELPV